MFTGIITNTGKVIEKTESTVTIESDKTLIRKLQSGMSIAVDGICLTVLSKKEKTFTIDFMPETAKRTTIRYLQIGDRVNLELPATSSTYLSGHIVQGHIDSLVEITDISKNGNSHIFTFSVPNSLSKYIVEKGSVAVNGISLTVISAKDSCFTVGIIPHTWDSTMLNGAKVRDYVNLEVDILAKYIEKLIQK